MPEFEHAFVVRAPLTRTWAFHADPFSLPKVTRKPLRLRVIHADQPLAVGSHIHLELRLGPIRRTWRVRVRDLQPPYAFTDEQLPGEGPFRRWVHTHAFEKIDATHTRVVDRLSFDLHGGLLGTVVGWLMARLILPLAFAARAAATRSILEQEP